MRDEQRSTASASLATDDAEQVRSRYRTAVRDVRSISDARGVVDVVRFWGLAAAAMVLVTATSFHWLACVVAIIAVAKAQNSLLLVGHDAGHHQVLSNRTLNDRVGECMTTAPMGVGFRTARITHLDHHRYLSTPADIEWELHDLPRPSRAALVRHLMLPLVGEYPVRAAAARLGIDLSGRHEPRYEITRRDALLDLVGMLVAQIVLFAVLSIFDWRLYVFFWLLPLLTITALFHKAKAYVDHAKLPTDPDGSLYSYHPSLPDQLFFGTLQARHAEHHLSPNVPYYRLRHLESLARELPEVEYRGGYFAFIATSYRALPSRRA